MKPKLMTCLLASSLCVVIANAPAAAQTTKQGGSLQIGIHKFEMKEGKIYVLKAIGKGFRPTADLKPGFKSFRSPSDFNIRNRVEMVFAPERNGTYTVRVATSLFGLSGTDKKWDYTVTSKLLTPDKTILNVKSALTKDDPPFKLKFNKREYHKSYEIKLKASTWYVIDLMRRGEDNRLDPYLFLLDSKNKIVERDDDSGSGRNARIVIYAKTTGTYRIIAAPLFKSVGDFTLTVQSAK